MMTIFCLLSFFFLVIESVYSQQLLLTNLAAALTQVKDGVDNKLFLYQTPSYQWIPSTVYRYDDFLESLKVMSTTPVANKKFYIGEDVTNGHVYGMVNIAAFLAQSMKETIKYDACDENSWDLVGGKYPLSNACGQLGQSYQDYHCSEEEKHMECPVDPNMSITAVTHARWYGAPAPLYCGPKTDEQPFSGFWDHSYSCDRSWANPPESCDVYEDQKAGQFDHSKPYANTAGRTDVEGCCWWGRGVIQTTGVCNFGKLNYYLGARAAEEGRPYKYDIDFCKDPEQICSSTRYKELKWVAGMFYWMESVQSYNEGGWRYMDELAKFVEGGMQGTAFIDAVSGIVNRGCHNPPCGTGAVDGTYERSQNFKKVLETFFVGNIPELSPLDSYSYDSPITATEGMFSSPEPEPSVSNSAFASSVVTGPGPIEVTDPPQSQSSSTNIQVTNSVSSSPTFLCDEHGSLFSDLTHVAIKFRYELVISQSLDDALVEVKREAMSSLAESLSGCTFGLIGIEEGIDEIDSEKKTCTKASFSECIPIISRFTGLFSSTTSADDVLKAKEQIASIIQQGMLEGRYNSDQIRWIVFNSELDQDTTRLESVYIMPQRSSNGSVWIPIASTLICALIVSIIICLIILVKEEMKKNDGCISSGQVLPATQSVVQKLVETKNHSSQESSCSSLESEVSATASPEVMHLQESQDMDASCVHPRTYLQCDDQQQEP